MSQPVQLSWDNFSANYVGGPPRAVVLPGPAKLRMFVDATGFGMWVPLGRNVLLPPSPLRCVLLRQVAQSTGAAIEIRTTTGSESKEFFYFLLAIADAIQLKGQSFEDAFREGMSAWRSLLQLVMRMTEAEEIGLLGELLTLERLIDLLGSRAVTHWTGPFKDRHDFRVDKVELEVKTTVTADAIHVINGLHQLDPSEGCRLYLLSWQLQRAGLGAGRTLPEQIDLLKARLRRSPRYSARFDMALTKGTRWDDADRTLFSERWVERRAPVAVAIDSACPRITRPVLRGGLPDSLLGLLTDVHYRVNVEGRGTTMTPDVLADLLSDPNS